MQNERHTQHLFNYMTMMVLIIIIFIVDWISTINLSTAALYVIPLHISIFKIENRLLVYKLLFLTLALLGLGCIFSHSHDFYVSIINHVIAGIVITTSFFISLKFKKLADNLQWMQQLVNEFTDYVFQADSDGKILFYNQALKKTSKLDNLSGSSYGDIYNQKEVAMIKSKIIPSAVKFGTWSGETQVRDSKGNPILTSTLVIAHKNKQGDLLRLSWIHRGISEQRKLEQREKLLLEIINKSSDLIYQIDSRKKVLFSNKSLIEKIGVKVNESIKIEQIHPEKDLEKLYNKIIPCLLSKGTWEGELNVYSKSNKKLQTSTVFITHKNAYGSNIAYSAILRDISDKIRNIDHQKALNSRLEDTIKELERSNSDLDDFAYIASHDLRSPLRGIDNLSRWVLEDQDNKLSRRSKEDMEKLQGRVQRLNNLLESLLQYSRAGRLEQDIGIINFREMVTEIVDFLSPPKEYTFSISTDMKVISIKHSPFKTVLMNLIGNAIKHRISDQGKVSIYLLAEKEWLRISVSDDGEGIPEKHHERIFGMFKTLKSRDRKESSGMGLAIVKKIVEREGGKIQVRNNKPSGVCFTFEWPVHANISETLAPTKNNEIGLLQ
ncbi:MAG: ATP-binding protein [Oligoflexales bacterium]